MFEALTHIRMSASRDWTLRWSVRRSVQAIGDESEEAFDLVEPGGAGRGEMHVEASVVPEPCRHRLGLVGLIAVADEVDLEAFKDFGVKLARTS